MEQLLLLQRKNELLLALADQLEAGHQALDQSALAETLLVLTDAFGGGDLVRRLRLLCDFASPLGDEKLEAVAGAAAASRKAEASAGTVAACPPSPLGGAARCHATLEGMELAQSALEDFVSSYFMFHGLDADSPSEVFRYLPALAFVEAHIYGLDQANEDNLLPPRGPDDLRGREPPPGRDPFGPLRAVLRERDWLTPRIEAELAEGAKFWALERRLCGALLDGPRDGAAPRIRREEAEAALRLKTFDYRIMNLLLYSMRRAEPDEGHLAFLGTAEILVEVGDDLADYADDVEHNSFNIYRCFLASFGQERGRLELMDFIRTAEEQYAAALSGLDGSVAARWRRRCEAVGRHGVGSERGPGGGSWELPPPIDEAALRRAACR